MVTIAKKYCYDPMYRTYSGYNSITDLKIERDLERWLQEKRCAERHTAFKFGEIAKVRKQK